MLWMMCKLANRSNVTIMWQNRLNDLFIHRKTGNGYADNVLTAATLSFFSQKNLELDQ